MAATRTHAGTGAARAAIDGCDKDADEAGCDKDTDETSSEGNARWQSCDKDTDKRNGCEENNNADSLSRHYLWIESGVVNLGRRDYQPHSSYFTL